MEQRLRLIPEELKEKLGSMGCMANTPCAVDVYYMRGSVVHRTGHTHFRETPVCKAHGEAWARKRGVPIPD